MIVTFLVRIERMVGNVSPIYKQYYILSDKSLITVCIQEYTHIYIVHQVFNNAFLQGSTGSGFSSNIPKKSALKGIHN